MKQVTLNLTIDAGSQLFSVASKPFQDLCPTCYFEPNTNEQSNYNCSISYSDQSGYQGIVSYIDILLSNNTCSDNSNVNENSIINAPNITLCSIINENNFFQDDNTLRIRALSNNDNYDNFEGILGLAMNEEIEKGSHTFIDSLYYNNIIKSKAFGLWFNDTVFGYSTYSMQDLSDTSSLYMSNINHDHASINDNIVDNDKTGHIIDGFVVFGDASFDTNNLPIIYNKIDPKNEPIEIKYINNSKNTNQPYLYWIEIYNIIIDNQSLNLTDYFKYNDTGTIIDSGNSYTLSLNNYVYNCL